MPGSSPTYIPHGCNNTINNNNNNNNNTEGAVHHCPHDTLVSLSILSPWFGRISQHLQRIIIPLQLSSIYQREAETGTGSGRQGKTRMIERHGRLIPQHRKDSGASAWRNYSGYPKPG
jgi:hypothetical protein